MLQYEIANIGEVLAQVLGLCTSLSGPLPPTVGVAGSRAGARAAAFGQATIAATLAAAASRAGFSYRDPPGDGAARRKLTGRDEIEEVREALLGLCECYAGVARFPGRSGVAFPEVLGEVARRE